MMRFEQLFILAGLVGTPQLLQKERGKYNTFVIADRKELWLSYVWQEGSSDPALIALSHKNGKLSIHRIQGSQLICTTELHRLTLKSLIKEQIHADLAVCDTELLGFSADLLTVLVDRQLILQLHINETKPWQIIYKVECPHKVLHGSVKGSIITIVDSDHSILLHSLDNGDFLAAIQREKNRHWSNCRLTADYLHMILQDDTGALHCCNLDRYFKENSLLLNRAQCLAQDAGANCGTAHWFNKLSFSDSGKVLVDRKVHSSKILYKVPFQGDCLSYQSTEDYISAVCLYKGAMWLSSYCLSTGSVERMEFSGEEHVVLSNLNTVPHILLSASQICAVTIGHFSKLYTPADVKRGLLEEIIKKNRWSEETLTSNIHRLKLALEIRDLHPVIEYIKSNSSFLEDIMRSPPIDHRQEVEQMCSLVHTAVSTYISHSTTSSFATQVIEAMLVYLEEQTRRGIALLNEMLMAENTEKRELVESLLERFSDHVMSFREVLNARSKVEGTRGKVNESSKKSKVKGKKGKDGGKGTASSRKVSAVNEDLVTKWNSLSSKELIGDGVLMGDISLIQSYFSLHNRESEASWDFIVKIGLQCVLDELEARNWPTACQMLKNLGFGVFTKLSQIAMYTTDAKLRLYLVKQLEHENVFSDSDVQAIQFSAEIDRHYPCESFQEAVSAGRSGTCDNFPRSDTFQLSKLCGDVGVVTSSPDLIKSRWYSHYMLDWASHWMPHRHDIYIDRYIHEKEGSSSGDLSGVPGEAVWSYLCRHNLVNTITRWIDVQYSDDKADRDFQNEPITANMVDVCLTLLPLNSRTTVSVKLLGHGVLSSPVLSSVQQKFSSLCSSGLILKREKVEGLISVPEFISHCFDKNLLHLIYDYFNTWGIVESELRRLDSSLPGKDYLLLMMLYSFYKLSVTGPDCRSLLDASLASSRYLARNPYLSRSELLDKQLTDVTQCDLMYHNPLLEGSPVSLTQEQIRLYKEHSIFRHLLDNEGGGVADDAETITVYTLLRKWGTLRADRVFAAQMEGLHANTTVKDLFAEMPHFADEALSVKFGMEEKLTYLHYLKQARPCFAYLVFISDETSMCNGSTIPASRLNLAINQTQFVAIKFYERLEVCASCVAFLELLGEETDKLRLLINSAQIIHRGRQLRDSTIDPSVLQYEVETLVLPLTFSKKQNVKGTYAELTEAADVCINSEPVSSTSIEAGFKWRAVIEFSREYNLALPTRYLEHCAVDNNWLSFLVYCQTFDYDRYQIFYAVNMFTEDSIREHLQCVFDCNSGTHDHSAAHDSNQHEKRTQLHDKMVAESSKRHSDNPVLISSSEDETRRGLKEKQSDHLPSLDLNPLPGTIASHHFGDTSLLSLEHVPNDIFAILFMTSNWINPWKQLNMFSVLLENPVLAVLSACHKESNALECLSSWLLSSVPETSTLIPDYMDTHTSQYISRKICIDVVQLLIDKRQLLLLRTGLRIFIKTSPLILLLDALEQLEAQMFSVVSMKLNKFKLSMRSTMSCRNTPDADFTYEDLISLSLHVIQTCVARSDSFLCERLLHLLDEANLLTLFRTQRVDFSRAYKVYKIVYDFRLPGVNQRRLVSPDCLDEAENVLKILESIREFDTARQLSLVCDLDAGLVTIQELISDIEQAVGQPSWQRDINHSDFWAKIQNKCVRHDLDPERCSAFFEAQSPLRSDMADKIILSQYALDWRRQVPSDFESNEIGRLQKLVWKNKINLLLEQRQEMDDYIYEKVVPRSFVRRPLNSVSIDKTQFLLSEYAISDFISLLTKSETPELNKSNYYKAVGELISQLLEDCKIDEACQISLEYGYTTQDVVIILTCMSLATHKCDPLKLDSRIRCIIGEERPVKRRTSSLSQGYLLAVSSVDNFGVGSPSPTNTKTDAYHDVLERLSEKCQHGAMACDKIVCCYAIALALGQFYKDTVLQSEYSLLKQLLASRVGDRFKLALDYINTCSLSDSDIASFLASYFYNSLRDIAGIDNNIESVSEHQLITSAEDCAKTGREGKQLIQLFNDQTVFGSSLLEQATNITIDETDAKLKLAVKVELLILSHDAFTCAYDMEGISSVLRSCRGCAIQINEVSYYPIMIHLLTGIGRFSEMTYVFDTLKQNHQFELLFRKGMSKEPKLKMAVLDYLRRFCPGDNDIYRVVSSHFAMYREIAQLLEQAALSKLSELGLTKGDGVSSALSDIQKNLTDAAEIYIEGQCLGHAQGCVKQARLVFLQASLLSSGTQVINLEPIHVRDFIEHHDKFYEVFTVSEAYNKNFWAAALCNNVIIKGDMKYLKEFKRSLVFTPSLITEIVQRFELKAEAGRTLQTTNSLRRLLSYCKDVTIKYKLAQGLGLHELTSELTNGENGAVGAVIRDSKYYRP